MPLGFPIPLYFCSFGQTPFKKILDLPQLTTSHKLFIFTSYYLYSVGTKAYLLALICWWGPIRLKKHCPWSLRSRGYGYQRNTKAIWLFLRNRTSTLLSSFYFSSLILTFKDKMICISVIHVLCTMYLCMLPLGSVNIYKLQIVILISRNAMNDAQSIALLKLAMWIIGRDIKEFPLYLLAIKRKPGEFKKQK